MSQRHEDHSQLGAGSCLTPGSQQDQRQGHQHQIANKISDDDEQHRGFTQYGCKHGNTNKGDIREGTIECLKGTRGKGISKKS